MNRTEDEKRYLRIRKTFRRQAIALVQFIVATENLTPEEAGKVVASALIDFGTLLADAFGQEVEGGEFSVERRAALEVYLKSLDLRYYLDDAEKAARN